MPPSWMRTCLTLRARASTRAPMLSRFDFVPSGSISGRALLSTSVHAAARLSSERLRDRNHSSVTSSKSEGCFIRGMI